MNGNVVGRMPCFGRAGTMRPIWYRHGLTMTRPDRLPDCLTVWIRPKPYRKEP